MHHIHKLLSFTIFLGTTAVSEGKNTPEVVPEELIKQIPEGIESIRGSRTCELFELKIKDANLILNVWSNTNLHDCPDEWLAQVDTSQYYVGGPRWRSLDVQLALRQDGTLDTSAASPVDPGDLTEVPAGLGFHMLRAATVAIAPVSALEKQLGIEIQTPNDLPPQLRQKLMGGGVQEYAVVNVDRIVNTIFRYDAGKPIYTLHNGNCTYAMKYSSGEVNRSFQDSERLLELGVLYTQIPSDWTYEVMTFEQDMYILDSKNLQFVVTDEFKNSFDLLMCDDANDNEKDDDDDDDDDGEDSPSASLPPSTSSTCWVPSVLVIAWVGLFLPATTLLVL